MPLACAAAVVAACALAPLVPLVARAFSTGAPHAFATIFRERTGLLLTHTVLLAAVVSVACLVLGVALAWAVTRVRVPGVRVWRVLLCLPLAVPSFVAAFAWSSVAPGLHGFWPLALVLVVSTVPYVTVPAIGAFAIADHALGDVARSLGRGPTRVFFTITLPQVLPAAAAGTLLVALYVLSDFGAPAILRFETLTTGVYAQVSGGFDRAAASATALVLAALALVCVALERRVRRRPNRVSARAGGRRSAPATPSPPVRILLVGLLSIVTFAGVVFPVGALGIRMLTSDRYASAPVDLVAALTTTLALAVGAAAITVFASLPVATLAARWRAPIARLLESASYLGHAIPGIVVALALIALALQLAPGFYQTTGLLLAAYVILFLPKAIGSARSGIEQVPRACEDVSRTLGAGAFATWRRVTVPGALPGILAGAVLVATAVMKELPATLMLRPIGLETLATELWSKTSLGAYGAAAPAGLLLILAGVVPAWWLARSVERAVSDPLPGGGA